MVFHQGTLGSTSAHPVSILAAGLTVCVCVCEKEGCWRAVVAVHTPVLWASLKDLENDIKNIEK